MARSYQSDVVDDSEPEREELRFQERCERKRGLKDHIQYQNLKDPLAVASLLDDNFASSQGSTSASSSKASVEVMDIQLPYVTPTVRHTHPMDIIQSITEDDEPKISLARFAYSGTMTTKKTSIKTGLSRQASITGSIVDFQLPAKKSTHRFTLHFPDSDLKKVTKCVSCDVRWTARKTVTQKMLHIQSCAKKKGLTDETVQVLLRKEIESCVEDSKSHEGKEIEKCVDSQTLFEGVVAETAPKKKARRKEAIETVKTISGTRDTILERARAIIAPTSSSWPTDEEESPLNTQILGASGSHFNNIVPPSTQAFGKSALAQARQTTRRLFDYGAESSDTEGHLDGTPSNPTFAPSRPAFHLNAKRPLSSSANHISVRQLPSVDIIDDSSIERVLNPRTKTPHEKFNGSTPFNKPLLSPERDDNGHSFIIHNRDMSIIDSLDHDNAFLPIDPEFDHVSDDMPITRTIRTKAESTLLTASPSKIRPQTPTKSKAATKSTASIKTKKNCVKTKMKSPLDDETMESLESRFKDKISQDTDLHLRVLRYEPIHFDVFLKLILGDSFSSASDKARLRMRSLLDKEAIHFYGSEKKRRRRR